MGRWENRRWKLFCHERCQSSKKARLWEFLSKITSQIRWSRDIFERAQNNVRRHWRRFDWSDLFHTGGIDADSLDFKIQTGCEWMFHSEERLQHSDGSFQSFLQQDKKVYGQRKQSMVFSWRTRTESASKCLDPGHQTGCFDGKKPEQVNVACIGFALKQANVYK